MLRMLIERPSADDEALCFFKIVWNKLKRIELDKYMRYPPSYSHCIALILTLLF